MEKVDIARSVVTSMGSATQTRVANRTVLGVEPEE